MIPRELLRFFLQEYHLKGFANAKTPSIVRQGGIRDEDQNLTTGEVRRAPSYKNCCVVRDEAKERAICSKEMVLVGRGV